MADAQVGEGMGEGERQGMKEVFNREREWRISAEAERDEWKANAERKMARLRIADEVIAAAEQALRERTSALERIVDAAKEFKPVAQHVAGHTCVFCPPDVLATQDQYENPCQLRKIAHAIIASAAPQQTGEGA